jgi:iron(II)-dependent oxidoreductase
MAAHAIKITSLPADAELALGALDEARNATFGLIAHLGDADLERVHSEIMSPLVWDLGHIAAYEDLWIAHRHGGLELLHPELAALYDAFETPRAVRGEIEKLGPDAARRYLAEVRERSVAVIAGRGAGDGVLCELVTRHEHQHAETMRQTMAIAGLLAGGEGVLAAVDGDDRFLTVPAASFQIGSSGEGFAYDNERPRHEVELPAFQIARRPVTNSSWMHFSEGGGYERREWWSREGWAWKEDYDITRHPAVAEGEEQAPVCHVSWFEADAFARAHEARLPSEAEWERAATWERDGGHSSELGSLAGAGAVWEWTASHFAGYPGFQAFPYREYSEVFFGDSYRVLRGRSWATHPRVAGVHFRNWDLPERRQIFAGLRLARDEG